MASYREAWMPDSMHGSRARHEVIDVSPEHSMNMQLAVAMGIPKAAMSLYWSKFFDCPERDIGNELMQEAMTNDSEGLLVAEAGTVFTEQSQCRFKIGKAISEKAETRSNGFLQGPSY